MNTANTFSGSEVRLPSGSEVESASFHPPVTVSWDEPPARSGVMAKLDDLKSRSMSKVQSMQRAAGDRYGLMKSNVSRSVTSTKSSLRYGAKRQVTAVNDSMRTSPMKWAGIAAGAGLGLGLIGRVLHARRNRPMPQLIIIESTC